MQRIMKLKIKSSLGSQIAERNAKAKSSKKSRRFAQRAINKKIRYQNKRVCIENTRCASDERAVIFRSKNLSSMDSIGHNSGAETLKHNIAGTLATLYVGYLAKYCQKIDFEYFRNNWRKEYEVRMEQMQDSSLVPVLNGYNAFYNKTIAQSGDCRIKFYFE